MKKYRAAAFKLSSSPAESPEVRLKRLRVSQFTRWSRALNSVAMLAVSLFIASACFNYLGITVLAALTAIAGAAGAFVMNRQVEEWNFQLEAPDFSAETPRIGTQKLSTVDSMPTLL